MKPTLLKYSYLFISSCFLLFIFCQCKSNKEIITELKICDCKDEWKCLTDQSVFYNNPDTLYFFFKVNDTKNSNSVKVSWYFLGNHPVLIHESDIFFKADENKMNYETFLAIPSTGWPSGVYEVKIKFNSNGSKTEVCSFQIK